MELKELIRTRYSCKAYDRGRQLSPDTLAEILEGDGIFYIVCTLKHVV